MPQSLFTTQVPTIPDAADGSDNYSMGTYFRPAVNGTITHIRWYFPITPQPGGQAPKAGLFRFTDQVKLSGADVSFAVPGNLGGWNQVALSSPVPVVAEVVYAAAIWTPLRYVASSGASSPWPLTNGQLSTPATAGRFTSGASGNVDFPNANFNEGCYFVDVVFVPEGEGEPTGLQVSVWNGSVELPATITVWNGTAEVPAQVAEIST